MNQVPGSLRDFRLRDMSHSHYPVAEDLFGGYSFFACFSSESVSSHLFLSLIEARTLKMPVPYPPPNVGAYTRTPSHNNLSSAVGAQIISHGFSLNFFCFLGQWYLPVKFPRY